MTRTAALRTSSSKFARTSVAQGEPKAMAHQLVSLKHDETVDCVYDASDAGTGKTYVRIAAFRKRRKKAGGCALILAPKTLLHSAWANDFKKFAPELKVSVARAENRDKAFAVDADAYITNHDAVKWLVKQKPAFWAKFTELIVDELPAFKHKDSQRSRAMAKIAFHYFGEGKHAKGKKTHRAGMSATPNSNGICDIWHQVYVLDNGKRLGSSYYAFRGTVCEPTQVARDARAIEWSDKEGAEEAVFGLLADMVIRHKLDDCADIPQTHHYPVEYELPATQRRAYDQLELTQILQFASHEDVTAKLTGVAPTTTSVTAINAAAVATKLLQVCSGAVYDGTGGYKIVDFGRYEMILDLVEARLNQHPLVFFQWKHQKELLVDEAERRKLSYAVIDGETKETNRDAIVKTYQTGAYDVVFAHPRTAAHGLTLTKGTSTIWAGPIYDLELFEQGSRRQRRIGQSKKTEVVMVLAPNTIEERVYGLLMNKDRRMKTLLDLFSVMAQELSK